MTQLYYPNYQIRESLGLPTNLADPYLMENTIKAIEQKNFVMLRDVCDTKYGYTRSDAAIDTMKFYRMKNKKRVKNTSITVWHDIIKLSSFDCIVGKKFILDDIIDEYVSIRYHSFPTIKTVLKGNNEYIVIITIGAIGYDGRMLDISYNTIYNGASALKKVFNDLTGKTKNVVCVPSDTDYNYLDYTGLNEAVWFF